MIAWAVGSVVGLLTIQTQLFSGPLSGIAFGVDVSLLLGALGRRADLPAAARAAAPGRA